MALPKPVIPTYELDLPSTGKTIKIRPFLVKEEKVLLLAAQSENEKEIINAITDIVKSCILSRIKVQDLTFFDLEYVFLQLRARSTEEFLSLDVTCKDDGVTKVIHRVNLLEVEVDGRYEKGNNKIMLGEDWGVIMKYPGMNDFVRFDIMRKELDDDQIYEYIASNIDQMFTAEDITECVDEKKEDIVDCVENLTSKQLDKIAEFYENQPKLSHTFTVKNPETGVDSEYTMEGLLNFIGG